MKQTSINLLPPERLRAFRIMYVLRLSSVLVLMLGTLMIAHGALLVPAFLYLSEQVRSHEQELASLAVRTMGEEDAAARELSQIGAAVTRLERLRTVPAASPLLSVVLSVENSGITLSRFSYTPPDATGIGSLSISGEAVSREALRGYVERLSALSFVHRVDLPIGAYADESDIVFTLTLVGPLVP